MRKQKTQEKQLPQTKYIFSETEYKVVTEQLKILIRTAKYCLNWLEKENSEIFIINKNQKK